jgi:hypothetical protein
MYWVTSRYSDHHDVTPTAPGLGSPSKTEDPEQTPTEPQRGSKFLFQLGRSRQSSPVEVKSMQVNSIEDFLPRSGTLSRPSHRSQSPPNGSRKTARFRLMNRSMSCKKCIPFYERAPAKCERKILPQTPIARPLPIIPSGRPLL